MSDPNNVVQNTTHVVADTTNQTSAPAAPQDGAINQPAKTVPYDEFMKTNNTAQMAARVVRELQNEVAQLKSQQKPAEAPKAPAGVEERIAALESELKAERARAANDRLVSAIIKAATEQKVPADRLDFLEYRLRREHGEKLSDRGVPDAGDPNKYVTIPTLVSSLLQTQEGAVFRTAPTAAALPAAQQNAPTNTKTMTTSEWETVMRAGGEAYKAAFAAVKKGEIKLVD